MRGRVRLAAGLGAAGLLLAALAASALAAGGWGRPALVRLAAAELAERLGAEVSIGALGGPLYPTLVVEALDVRFPGGAELSLPRATLTWQLTWRGLSPGLHIADAELEGLQARGLDLQALGARGVPPAGPDAGHRAPPGDRFTWQRAALRGAELRLAEGAGLHVDADVEADPAGRWPSRARVSAELLPGSLAGRAVSGGTLGLELAGGQLAVQADVASPGGHLQAHGSLDVDAWRSGAGPAFSVEGRVDAFDLATWLADPRLHSSLAGPFAARSVPAREAPGGNAQWQASVAWAGSAAGAPLEHVAAQLHSEGAQWSADQIQVDGAALSLRGQANGSGATLGNLALEGQVEDLGVLATHIAPGFDGLRGRARFAARLAGPSLAGSLELHARELALGRTPLGSLELAAHSSAERELAIERLELPDLHLHLAPGEPPRLRLADGAELRSPLRLELGTGRISLSGALRATGLADAALDIQGLDLAALPPGLVGEPLAGTLRASLHITGAGASASTALEIRAEQLRAGELRADAVEVSASGRGRALRGTAQLRAAGGSAQLRFDLPALAALGDALAGRSAPGTSLEAEVTDLRAEALAPLFATWFDELRGTLNAHLALRPAKPLPELAVSVRLTDAEARSPLLPMREPLRAAEIHVEVDTQGGALRGRAALAQAGEPRLTLELRGAHPAAVGGFARLAERSDTRAELVAESWDAQLLEPWLPPWLDQPRGPLTGHVALQGPLVRPHWQGELRWSGGSVRAPLVRQTFAPLEASVRFDGERSVQIDLEAGPPAGALHARGTLELAGLRPDALDFELAFERLALARSPRLHADLSGRARIAGTAARPRLTGSLALLDARLALPDPLDVELAEIRIAGVDTTPAASPAVDRTEVDVELAIPSGSRLIGQGLDAQVHGSLRAVHAPGEPLRWLGNIETERGDYRLYRTRFEIARAQARFDGAAGFDPAIDAQAGARIAGTDVQLNVSGRLKKPLLAMSSKPPLPQQDLLALVLLGRKVDPLDPNESLNLGRAVSQLGSQFALNQLRQRVSTYLPIDQLETGVDAAGDPSIEVGKALRDDVFVRYGRSLGARATDEVTIEWELGPEVHVEGHVSREGESGADVIWSKDY